MKKALWAAYNVTKFLLAMLGLFVAIQIGHAYFEECGSISINEKFKKEAATHCAAQAANEVSDA